MICPYRTSCRKTACNLSGGECQRVSVARCFIRKSPIILVDEAEVALDAPMLWQYDPISVPRSGSVQQQGTFDELLEQKGYFRALHQISQ